MADRRTLPTDIDRSEVFFPDLELQGALRAAERRRAETETLLEAARAVLRYAKFQDAAQAIFNLTKGLIGATAGYVALLSDNGDENEVLFLDAGGRPCTVDPELPMPIRGLRAIAYETGKSAYDNDFRNSQWWDFMPEGHVMLENVLFAPLVIDGKAAGLLGLANKAGGFTEEDARIAGALGELTAVALQNSRTLEALQEARTELAAYSETLETRVRERTQELAAVQEKLVRQQRLAALGQLAGGVGHELRNPLGVMSNAVYMLRAMLTEAVPQVHEYLDIVSDEIETSEKIVHALLDFGRVVVSDRDYVALGSLISQALTRSPAPAGVTVVVDAPPDLPSVYVDAVQLREVLNNLIVNAYEAMPDGGTLALAATAVDGHVEVRVKDSGHGMSGETADMVFEPLFTTKPRGMGLGLAITRKLVEAHGGTIDVRSELGVGTTFVVELPLSDGQQTTEPVVDAD